MPRIAILSDIHANLHALRRVLAEVDESGVDGVFCGGDLVGYGANPRECVELIRERGMPCVLGNHDSYAARLRDRAGELEKNPDVPGNPVWAGVLHAIRELSDDQSAWLRDLPLVEDLPEALLAHASLHDMANWPYLGDSDAAEPTLRLLEKMQTEVGFFGHTHQARVFFGAEHPRPELVGEGRILVPEGACCAITVGSVGQPRERDRRATWVVWDSEARLAEIRRTAYPQEEAAAAVRAAGLPEHSARRLLDAP
jgi:predicted phosphodiesterase